jgi:starvation-inducible DNA-binding protein
MTQLLATQPTGETGKTAEPLQATLVELIDLSLQAKQAHWNVVGPNFRGAHLFLDEVTDQYRGWYDEVAERLAAIGVSPDGRIGTLAASTPLDPLPAGQLRDVDVLAMFDQRVSLVVDRLRARLDPVGEHDLASQDILLGIIEGLEKQRWMLRAHLAG